MNNFSLERIWEDMEFFEIEVIAKSEFIQACGKFYTTTEKIDRLIASLSSFPQNSKDRFIWENGVKGDKFTPYISLEFWCVEKFGHIVIEVYMEIDDGGSYDKHNCCFYIKTEVGLLNNFGKSLALLNERGIGKKVTLNPEH